MHARDRPPSAVWLDALVFSSLWIAAAAGALTAAAARAMGAEASALPAALAAAGTLAVYNVDRLRDVARDRETAPLRSDFVTRHGGGVALLAVFAGALAVCLGAVAGPRALGVLAPVLLAGLLHRRLKRFAWGKSIYITAAWVAVVVGLPALLSEGARRVDWIAAVLTASIFANAIASNVRDREAASARLGPERALFFAKISAVTGVCLALLAPPPVRPLVGVPVLTLLALLRFRPGERYGLICVDGALLVGALPALLP